MDKKVFQKNLSSILKFKLFLNNLNPLCIGCYISSAIFPLLGWFISPIREYYILNLIDVFSYKVWWQVQFLILQILCAHPKSECTGHRRRNSLNLQKEVSTTRCKRSLHIGHRLMIPNTEKIVCRGPKEYIRVRQFLRRRKLEFFWYMALKIWLFNLHQLRTWCIWKSNYSKSIFKWRNLNSVIGFPNTPCA